MATPDTITQLVDGLKSITKYRETNLVRRPEWGGITFEVASQDIDMALSIAQDLSEMPLEHLTEDAASGIASHLPSVAEVLANIDGFTLAGNVDQARDDLVESVRGEAEGLRNAAAIWIPYLAYRRGDVAENLERLRGVIEEASREAEEAKEAASAKSAQLDAIVEASRTAAAAVGLGTFTHAFSKEADEVRVASQRWLVAAAVGGASAIAVAAGSFFWPSVSDDPTAWEIARVLFTKVSIISLLVAGTIWCGRMCKALRHQQTVNRHRALSLQTFQAFVSASDDVRIKDAVLMAATNSIFDNVSTGFVDSRSQRNDPAVQFVEIGKKADARS